MSDVSAREHEPVAMQLWSKLGAMMREQRVRSGRSLRDVEKSTGWGRGNLSQIENAKSRPSRAQVEQYDRDFGADGLLVSIYAEARGAHGPGDRRRRVESGRVPGDDLELVHTVAIVGELACPGTTVPAGWRVRNTGTVPWVGRELERVGPAAARGLIAGPGRIALADCPPGGEIDVAFAVEMPDVEATLAAYWQMVDEQGRPCLPGKPVFWVVLVGHRPVVDDGTT